MRNPCTRITAALSLLILAPLSQAAVPAAAATAVTDLVTDAGTYIGSLWPLAVAVVVGFVFFKLFKKGIARAT